MTDNIKLVVDNPSPLPATPERIKDESALTAGEIVHALNNALDEVGGVDVDAVLAPVVRAIRRRFDISLIDAELLLADVRADLVEMFDGQETEIVSEFERELKFLIDDEEED
jgi:hypothetical protein